LIGNGDCVLPTGQHGPTSRPLLAKLLRGSAQVLRPLAARVLREILASAVIQADETPVKYLGHERGKSSTGYLFGYAGDAEHRFLFYDYRASRSRAGPAEILADYQGVLLSDGFSGYEALVQEAEGRLRAAACWMHARREFDEARATTSHPLVERIFASLEAEAGQHRPSSPLAKAVQYALNRRVALSRFLEDGRIELDTGLLERSLRGPALGRKN
jgi:hypothetical protein